MADVRLANTDDRAGRTAEAIARLATNQRIVTAANSGELLDQLAADWYVDRSTNPDAQTRMVAEHHPLTDNCWRITGIRLISHTVGETTCT